MLPFVNTPKRPKAPEGKVREGIWQARRRYRPLLLTDRRLVRVRHASHTAPATLCCASFRVDLVRVVRTFPGSIGRQTLVLDLPADGEVPFELGRLDVVDLDAFTRAFGCQPRLVIVDVAPELTRCGVACARRAC